MVWHNEYSKSFAQGFEHAVQSLGVGEHPVDQRSIIDIGPNEILGDAFPTGKPDVFGVIGGPPCPDFSVAGKNRGEFGANGRLSLVYVRRIVELQPTFFLFENVPGLVQTARHRAFLGRLKLMLEADYAVSARLLNALDYGVPQDRLRLFVIGFHRRFLRQHRKLMVEPGWEDWYEWPEARYPGAKGRFTWPGRSRFGETPERPVGIPDELMVGPSIGVPEEVAHLPNGTEGFLPRSARLAEVDEGDDSRKSFKRLHRWRYSPTVAYGNNEVHLHPYLPRRINVREALRLQTVPDTYALPAEMPLSHKFKMIGNGVPVKLAEAVAESVRGFLQQ